MQWFICKSCEVQMHLGVLTDLLKEVLQFWLILKTVEDGVCA